MNTIDILEQRHYQKILNNSFAEKKARNPLFSIRGFAKFLEVDHSNLAKVMKGKKNISQKLVNTLTQKLDITTSDIYNKNNNTEDLYNSQSIDTFFATSSWYYDAILEMTKISNFIPSIKAISKRLGISIKKCTDAISTLSKLELLETSKENWVDISGHNTIISDCYSSPAQKKYQKEVLEKAIDSIDIYEKDLRSNSSLTMAIDKKDLPRFNEEIKKFRRNMSEIFEESQKDKDEVYQLVVALYPLTHPEQEHMQ